MLIMRWKGVIYHAAVTMHIYSILHTLAQQFLQAKPLAHFQASNSVNDFSLNILHSQEKDWMWHKARHNPLLGDNHHKHTHAHILSRFFPIQKLVTPNDPKVILFGHGKFIAT